MRLTKEYIGRKIRHSNWSETSLDGKLIFLHNNYVVYEKISECYLGTNDDYWILIEEPKKPSERIKELLRHDPLISHYEDRIDAIIFYLDEEFEKQSK